MQAYYRAAATEVFFPCVLMRLGALLAFNETLMDAKWVLTPVYIPFRNLTTLTGLRTLCNPLLQLAKEWASFPGGAREPLIVIRSMPCIGHSALDF